MNGHIEGRKSRTSVLAVLAAVFVCGVARAERHDLSDSTTARRLEGILPDPGNEGKASVTKLVIDTDALAIEVAGSVLARHKWGTVPAPTSRNPRRRVDAAAQKRLAFEFSFNLRDNKVSGAISLGRVVLSAFGYRLDLGEIKLDFDEIERLLTGDLNVLLELIPNPAPDVIRRERRNEYQRIRQSKYDLHGEENVYFATEDFVNWASPERVARWIVEAVLTSGASLEAAMKEVEMKSREQKTEIVNWLRMKTDEEVEETVERILRGERLTELPNLVLKWQPVRYESQVFVLNQPTTGWIGVNHGGFYLVWTGPGGSTNVDNDFPDPDDPNAPGVEPQWELGVDVYNKVQSALVLRVEAESPAERAGIQAGDSIFRVGQARAGLDDIDVLVSSQADGGEVVLLVGQLRDDVYSRNEITVDLREAE